MYSLLIHSTNRIFTVHRDGKIKVWDISILSEEMTFCEPGYRPQVLTKPVHVVQNSKPGYLVNDLLEYTQVGITTSDVVSTDTDGHIKLWLFHYHNPSDKSQLSLVAQYKLFDYAVVCRAITAKGWIVAGGERRWWPAESMWVKCASQGSQTSRSQQPDRQSKSKSSAV